LRELCGRLTRDGTAYAVPFTWFDAVDSADVTMGHGGPVETSLLRHLRPDLVDEAAFEDATTGGADSWGEVHSGTNLAYDTVEFSANGTVGDPRKSSAELGEALLEAAGENLAALLGTIASREWPREA
jgi:creatinine amidohydrolase